MRKREKFIDGIYNYCDRWCQRCRHTAVCRLFHDEQRSRRRHKARGEDPDAMDTTLQDVSRAFKKATRLISRYAKAHGLDLDEIAREAGDVDVDANSERIEDHPLCRQAKCYMNRCKDLLETLRPIFNDARSDAMQRARFMDVEPEADRLTDVREAFDVLTWDFRLIHVKTRRAVDGLLDAEQEEDEDSRGYSLDDAAGSAAVARRCLMRDKTALLTIYEWDERLEDTTIDLLALAEKTLRALDKTIPGCTTFAWPPQQTRP